MLIILWSLKWILTFLLFEVTAQTSAQTFCTDVATLFVFFIDVVYIKTKKTILVNWENVHLPWFCS